MHRSKGQVRSRVIMNNTSTVHVRPRPVKATARRRTYPALLVNWHLQRIQTYLIRVEEDPSLHIRFQRNALFIDAITLTNTLQAETYNHSL